MIQTNNQLITNLNNSPLLMTYGGVLSRLSPVYNFDVASNAFALRQLNERVSQCINVRRGSDNRLLIIGYKSGVLDTDKLLDFCNGSGGFVQAWFNQANIITSIKNLTQNTTANQPRIVNDNGTLVTQNGKPSIYFDGINDKLVNQDAGTNVNNATGTSITACVLVPDSQIITNASTGIIMCPWSGMLDNNTPNSACLRLTDVTSLYSILLTPRLGNFNGMYCSSTIPNSGLTSISGHYNYIGTGTSNMFLNNVSQTTTELTRSPNSNYSLAFGAIGCHRSTTGDREFFAGHISEVIHINRVNYASAATVTAPHNYTLDRLAIVNNQMAYYGIV
jgi:hypothetical protein